MNIFSIFNYIICKTPLIYIPIKIRKGISKGLWFTIFPFSSYWRLGGGEPDIEYAITLYCSKPGITCWDIGAHFGIYTLAMAKLVGSGGEVSSFEPDEFSYNKCKYHIKLNNLEWVNLYNFAVSSTDGNDYLLDGGRGVTYARLGYEEENNKEYKNKKEITKIKLDEYVNKNQIKIPQFIKIDIEGHGHKALSGAINIVKKNKPIILISFHSNSEVDATNEILISNGYNCFDCYGNKAEIPSSEFRGSLIFK